MFKILFVCTGNTCRSVMAEGLFKKILEEEALDEEMAVSSAGTSAFFSTPAAENAILALEELDIDIRDHKSTMLTDKLVYNADLILTMTKSHKDQILSMIPEAKEEVFTIIEYASDGEKGDILDPFGMDIETYRNCRDEIKNYLLKIIDKLRK